MADVLFFIAGIGAISGAIGVIAARNPFYSVLALVFHLLSLAALFLLLRAQFVAAAQVVVYAGAVMVLYVFVVAYVGDQERPLYAPTSNLGAVGVLFTGALAVEAVGAVILARRRRGIDTEADERRTLSVGDLFRRPPGIGTRAESVGTRPGGREEAAVGAKSADRDLGGW
ncbi:MAG: hypothetical protein E6G30_02315 [Actinobacteria bacterium]|nr:MAG: hypothetical protein E6G30_02315 [Actinomycetota bacterium]